MQCFLVQGQMTSEDSGSTTTTGGYIKSLVEIDSRVCHILAQPERNDNIRSSMKKPSLLLVVLVSATWGFLVFRWADHDSRDSIIASIPRKLVEWYSTKMNGADFLLARTCPGEQLIDLRNTL